MQKDISKLDSLEVRGYSSREFEILFESSEEKMEEKIEDKQPSDKVCNVIEESTDPI